MDTSPRNRGFIQLVIVLGVAVCVVLFVFFVFSKYFIPGALTPSIGVGGPTSPFSSGSTGPSNSGTNPLLDFSNYGGSDFSYGDNSRSKPNTDGSGRSAYSKQITLSYGTAAAAYQTFEEYVTLTNSGPAVDITGWTITNSKGSRPIQNIQNNYLYPTADSATIGTGTDFLNPTGNFETGHIILRSGDMAYLITAKPFSGYPFSIYTSFRENICVGYLKNYPFSPPLNNSCPSGTSDPFIKTVTDECYDYIRSLNRCVDPEKYDNKRFTQNITSQCQQFIRPRLNYAGCVAGNQNISNFSTKTWRIFLGKDKQLWLSSRETITLYDSNNLIVSQISY